jgi:hypothetical protein
MAKSKVTSQSLSGSDDAYVLSYMWRSSRSSCPWHGGPLIIINFYLHWSRIQLTITFVIRRIFWAFDLYPAVEGSTIDPAKILTHGMIRGPVPFQFHVSPRHPDVERIIESESAYADLHLKEWEF